MKAARFPQMTTFSRAQTLRILRLASRDLARWERFGLLPAQATYEFRDLTALRKLQQFAQHGIPLREIRAGVDSARASSGSECPLARLTLNACQRAALEIDVHGRRMDALSGQFYLDFEPPPGRLHLLPTRSKAPAAEDWFLYAVSLEDDPELREQAAEGYLSCIEADPNYSSAYINLGTLRYHQGDFAEAERCYRSALEIEPDYALAYFDLGNVLDETGRLREAIAAYREAVRLAPGYGDAHYNLALAHEKAGERRRAVPHWRQYLRIDRSSAWAAHARAQLKRALAREGLRVVHRRGPRPHSVQTLA